MSQRPQSLVVIGFGLGQIAAFACSFYLMGVLGDPIARELDLPDAFVFGTVSLSLLIPAFIAPAVARRIEAGDGKTVLVGSHLVFALGLLLLGLAEHGAVLLLAMTVIGLGMALGLSPTPFAILVGLYGDAARRPITAVALIGGLGSTVGWPLTGAVADALGWRGACFLWAAVQLLLILPMSAWACPAGRALGQRPKATTAEVRWDRSMVQLTVLFACAWFVSTCVSAHLPRLLAAFGLPMAAATAAAGLVGVAAVTVRFLEFTVLRRLPPILTARVATLLHPLGAAALLGFGGRAGAALAIGQGAGNGMLTVAKGVLPLSLYGADGYATRSALIGRPATVLQAAGPIVFAVVLERSPVAALALTSGLCLVMFAMTFGLHAAAAQPRRPAIA